MVDALLDRLGAELGDRVARVDESRKLYHLVKEQGRDGALGIVQGEHALGRIEFNEQARVKTSDPEVRSGVEPPARRGPMV